MSSRALEQLDEQERALIEQVAGEKLIDAMVPGFVVSMDPDEAELMGAFQEDALSAPAAMESAVDLLEAGDE